MRILERAAKIEEKVIELEKPWYRKPILAEDFSVFKGKDGKLYVTNRNWKSSVFVGPMDNIRQCDKVIEGYVLGKGSIKDIHSVVINDVKFLKKV